MLFIFYRLYDTEYGGAHSGNEIIQLFFNQHDIDTCFLEAPDDHEGVVLEPHHAVADDADGKWRENWFEKIKTHFVIELIQW
jgi:hypothetical protein